MIFRVLSPVLFIVLETLLQGWDPMLKSSASSQQLSFKDRLELEAQFHPSWMLRLFLWRWVVLVRQGYSLKKLLHFLPWALPSWELTLEDFSEILGHVVSKHPQPLPLGSLIRWLCVVGFALFATPFSVTDGEIVLCFLPLLGLAYELWCWGRWKQTLIVLSWWQRSPAQWSVLGPHGYPEPLFLSTKQDRRLWQRIWVIEPELYNCARRFAEYFTLVQRRRHHRARQFLGLMLDLSTLWLFTQMSSQLLQQFYHG